MRGLIEKDLRLTLRRKQTLLIFLLMAVIMSFSMEGPFIVGYMNMLAAIIAVSTISYDEYDNGFEFLMTLPFVRKTYVKEKYLFALMAVAAAWCLSILLYIAGNAFSHVPFDAASELPMLLANIPVLYIAAVVMIPLQLKYGAEKSRIALFVVFGAIAAITIGASRLFGASGQKAFAFVQNLESITPWMLLLIVFAVCALITFASYLLSIRVMEKKEF